MHLCWKFCWKGREILESSSALSLASWHVEPPWDSGFAQGHILGRKDNWWSTYSETSQRSIVQQLWVDLDAPRKPDDEKGDMAVEIHEHPWTSMKINEHLHLSMILPYCSSPTSDFHIFSLEGSYVPCHLVPISAKGYLAATPLRFGRGLWCEHVPWIRMISVYRNLGIQNLSRI